MKIKEIIVEVKINIFQWIVYSNLINECNELITEVDNVINQNLDEYYASSLLTGIVNMINVLDSIPNEGIKFPKIIRNRLQKSYKKLILNSSANLE